MIGVILWSDISERKAVVWCEDQGDLAFLGDNETPHENVVFFEAGDILDFDVELEGDFRRVNNPRLIRSHDTTDVAATLMRAGRSVAVEAAKVVPFPSRETVVPAAHSEPNIACLAEG